MECTHILILITSLFQVLFLSCVYSNLSESNSKVVHLSQGPVRGYKASEGGLFVFYNVPYATAPQGKYRFKAPLPPPVWTSIREAIDEKIVCPQADPANILSNRTVTPDCLIANIYIPETKEINLPVVVLVHGGGFQIGYGDMLKPTHVVKTQRVIVVNFNYRLGPHGFLCLGTSKAPGNAGMKDQVALLRWVKENIRQFGGNPDDVTLEGYSAGSVAVDLLLLSKSARGLFHKVIPESGSNLAPWGVQSDPIGTAKDYAENALNFTKLDDFYSLQELFLTLPFDSLMKDLTMSKLDVKYLFAPCVEKDLGFERFLEEAPFDILKRGDFNKVPMLYGFTNMEGLSRLSLNYKAFENGMNEKFSDFLPHDLKFKTKNEKETVASRVKQFYFGDKRIGEETVQGFIDYFTDITYAFSTVWSTTLKAKSGNDVYLYEFSFADTDAIMPEGFTAKIRGANHCAQSMMILDGNGAIGGSSDESALSEYVKTMKSIMREIWLSFITTGNPTTLNSSVPSWPPVSSTRVPHMSLSLEPVLRGAPILARAKLWTEIYDEFYLKPAAPAPPIGRHEL